jgi:hypothetical protein
VPEITSNVMRICRIWKLQSVFDYACLPLFISDVFETESLAAVANND